MNSRTLGPAQQALAPAGTAPPAHFPFPLPYYLPSLCPATHYPCLPNTNPSETQRLRALPALSCPAQHQPKHTAHPRFVQLPMTLLAPCCCLSVRWEHISGWECPKLRLQEGAVLWRCCTAAPGRIGARCAAEKCVCVYVHRHRHQHVCGFKFCKRAWRCLSWEGSTLRRRGGRGCIGGVQPQTINTLPRWGAAEASSTGIRSRLPHALPAQ